MKNFTKKHRVALFHNFMDNIGGAEIVTLTMARELKADIYTTNINEEKIKNMGFEDVLSHIHSIGTVPINAPWRHQSAFFKFSNLDMAKSYPNQTYDAYIICGDWAMSAVNKNKPAIWYVHSPLNELWAFKNYIRNNLLPWWKRPLYDIWVYYHRKKTIKYSVGFDVILCNSKNSQNRLKKFYKEDASILYPPTYTEKYSYKDTIKTDTKNGGYWLSVNRLIPHKNIEVQIEAFTKLPNENLIIVGSYEKGASQFESYKNKIEKLISNGEEKTGVKNIKIIHWADTENITKLYSECKGLIATAHDEDFGLSVVEAFASGKPVIASAEGGYLESITPETGLLIKNINGQNLSDAVKKMSEQLTNENSRMIFKKECQKRAALFDVHNFISKIVYITDTLLTKKESGITLWSIKK